MALLWLQWKDLCSDCMGFGLLQLWVDSVRQQRASPVGNLISRETHSSSVKETY